MYALTLDTETDTYNHGNPFDDRNKLVCFSLKEDGKPAKAFKWATPRVEYLQDLIDVADIIVGFNFKFDYHWFNKVGVQLDGKRIWDCQTAAYILSHQRSIFPSLDSVLAHYNLASKLDVVKLEYWDKGITTSDIPWPILRDYAAGDADRTERVFRLQWEEATPAQRALILLDGMDLHVLREMEDNGILYDKELCEQRAIDLDAKIRDAEEKLSQIYPHIPINFRSNDHLSAFLYGGKIDQHIKVHDGFYKTGLKKNQPKYKNDIIVHNLPALYKPLPGSELKKDGYFATNEPTLRMLKGNPKIVNMILDLAKLEKVNGTYYKGIPKISQEMHWTGNILHSNFNQTQTATGRLSSSKPNQQNFAGDILDIFITRYGE